jgi:glycosyltransferase involved in cell wall biosynthesis
MNFGADLVHAHLLSADEMRAIRASGFPLVVTLHNMPEAWPVGIRDGGSPVADLILACSRTVSEQAEAARLGAPVRTVWNGIDPSSVATSESREKVRSDWRKRLGWGADDFVLVVLANPRRQKRLERLPPILVALQERLGARRVRLLLAGEPARGSGDAEEAQAMLATAIEQCPLRANIHAAGALQAIGDALAAGDVLLAVSAFEGLSLAQLEALAAGLPVVATDVGGAREIAAHTTALKLVPSAATDDEVVAALAEIAALPSVSEITLPRSFTRSEMVARTRWFYSQILRPRRSPGEGLWLITNNFSTGGAQSSARRLLVGLAARGIKVRAAVVEEHPSRPTPGRAALDGAGVPVLAIPPPGAIDAPEAVARLLAAIDAAPPRAILFWNLIPVFKILLADALLDVSIFDVSPGEMYFASLARYFANPRPALPYLDAREYGSRLAGVVVKYAAEGEIASRTLGPAVHVIRNGVLLSDAPRPQRNRRRFIIGTAARLSPDKRLGDLIEAVRLAAPRLPRFVLRIAGGPERGSEEHAQDLRRQARGLPVKWCGELSDTRDFLADLDLFVMISEPPGCPNASLEALAAGVPVIATDVGGAREQVVDDKNGRLVPARDANALANAMVDLAHDPARRAVFAEAGQAHMRANFSLEKMLDDYARLCGF